MDKNDKYKIIKEIGIGLMGTVYLVEKSNNKYAMKIEKILKKQCVESLKYDIWREIEFSNTMSKYPNHFMKLYDHWINKDCNHIQNWNKIGMKLEFFNKSAQKYYKSLIDSSYCSIKVYSIVDTTLKNIANKLTKEEYNDIFIQCLYVMYLCNKSGYLHRDWKMDNIGLNKTENKYIDIFDFKVKTHGYIVVLLDYGAIIHKKYILSAYEKKIFTSKLTDLFFMFDRYKYNMIYNFKKVERKHGINNIDPIKINENMDKYLPKFNDNNKVLEQYIYKIKHYKPDLLLPEQTIEQLIKNIYNIKRCIKLLC